MDGKTLALVLDDLQSCGAWPLLLEAKPATAIAFSNEGLALETTASLPKGMEQADPDKRWEAFRQQIIAMNKPEIWENASGLRLVFASESLRYELLLTSGEPEAELRIRHR